MPEPITAYHTHWCHWESHGECCSLTEDDCDCGAREVNVELARLRARVAELEDQLTGEGDTPTTPLNSRAWMIGRHLPRRRRSTD